MTATAESSAAALQDIARVLDAISTQAAIPLNAILQDPGAAGSLNTDLAATLGLEAWVQYRAQTVMHFCARDLYDDWNRLNVAIEALCEQHSATLPVDYEISSLSGKLDVDARHLAVDTYLYGFRDGRVMRLVSDMVGTDRIPTAAQWPTKPADLTVRDIDLECADVEMRAFWRRADAVCGARAAGLDWHALGELTGWTSDQLASLAEPASTTPQEAREGVYRERGAAILCPRCNATGAAPDGAEEPATVTPARHAGEVTNGQAFEEQLADVDMHDMAAFWTRADLLLKAHGVGRTWTDLALVTGRSWRTVKRWADLAAATPPRERMEAWRKLQRIEASV